MGFQVFSILLVYTEVYVVDSDIKDDDGKGVRFHIIFSTKKIKARMSSKLMQDDATYRLNWMGFPVFVSGRSSITDKFFPCTSPCHRTRTTLPGPPPSGG